MELLTLSLLVLAAGVMAGKRASLRQSQLPLDFQHSAISPFLCRQLPMPRTSHFIGMEPPRDRERWDQAIKDACEGKLVLLEKVFQVTQNRPNDIYGDGLNYMWSHSLGDIHMINGMNFETALKEYRQRGFSKTTRAPVVHLGHRPKKEGGHRGFKQFSPKNICEFEEKIPEKIVVIGCMDSNWGYFSTNLMNRSTYWAEHLSKEGKKKGLSSQQLVQAFLDDPNVLMMIVNGHNNISHPKLVSMPLGPTNPQSCYNVEEKVIAANAAGENRYRKRNLLLTAGSNFRFRPAIRQCVSDTMGSEMEVIRQKLDPMKFMVKVVESVAVLCMPGMGYDTYRLWETLLLGSMPVVEKGCGMDRTFWKLPVLAVDDFASVNPSLIHSAYVEALYRRDEWEYRRLLRSFWKDIVDEVSTSKSNKVLMDLFPMKAVDEGFTRPLFAFNCQEMGGCGPGTKRTPSKYCSIDTSVNGDHFDFWAQWIKKKKQ